MGLFSKISQAETSLGGIYLNEPHKYVLEIAAAKLITSRKGDSLFIGEFIVVTSDDPRLPTGFKPSWVCSMKQDAALGNILTFIGAAMGIDPQDEATLRREVTEDVSELVVSAKNPLRGKFVEVVTKNVKTRANTDFTKHFWGPSKYAGPSQLTAAPTPAYPMTQVGGTTAVGAAYPPPVSAGLPPPPPPMAAPPPPPAPFPPPGWTAHPTSPGWFYQGQKVVSEVDLRAGRI